jgi:hypothetical protein
MLQLDARAYLSLVSDAGVGNRGLSTITAYVLSASSRIVQCSIQNLDKLLPSLLIIDHKSHRTSENISADVKPEMAVSLYVLGPNLSQGMRDN